MAKYIEINGKSIQVKPSSHKIYNFLLNNQDKNGCIITDLAEFTGLAYSGISRYINELADLDVITIKIDNDGSIRYKRIYLKEKPSKDINPKDNKPKDNKPKVIKPKDNKPKMKKFSNIDNSDIKKLDELFRIMCVRRATTNDNLEAFQSIINKIKGVDLNDLL